MNVGDEGLDAISYEFHRTPDQPRNRNRGNLIGVEMDLDAERTADVGTHHADAALVEAEMRRIKRPQLVRRCVALMYRQAVIAGQIAGDDAARLHRTAGQSVEVERLLDHQRGRRERIVARFVTD